MTGVGRFLGDLPNRHMHWGWKNPRSMYVLPLIARLFPRVRFIHLIRDGRDMATSENQNQPRKHYQALFGQDLDESDPAGSIQLWAAANLGCANWAERNLGSRYLRVRFEDLCDEPVQTVASILHFAEFENISDEIIDNIAEKSVLRPETLGRWRSLDPMVADALTRRGGDALTHFGYHGSMAPRIDKPHAPKT
jgi:hypothetical protein